MEEEEFLESETEEEEEDFSRFDTYIADLDLEEIKGLPVFDCKSEKWLAVEEILLLTAQQVYGFGCWSKVAKILTRYCNKRFTADDVEEHYNRIYMRGSIRNAFFTLHEANFPFPVTDHIPDEDEKLLTSVDANAHENVPKSFLKEIGYYPLREDFELEYDEDAETRIEEITFIDNDEYDKNLHFVIVDEFRGRIKERLKKKKYIKDLRLVEQYYASLNPYEEEKVKMEIKDVDLLSIAPEYGKENMILAPIITSRDFKTYLREYAEYQQKNERIMKKVMGIDLDFEELYAAVRAINPGNVTCEKKFKFLTKTGRKRRNMPEHESKKRKKKSEKIFSLRPPSPCPSNRRHRFRRKTRSSCNIKKSYAIESDSDCESDDLLPTIDEYPCGEYLSEDEKNFCAELGLRPIYFLYYKTYLKQVECLAQKGYHLKVSLLPESCKIEECARIIKFLCDSGWLEDTDLFDLGIDEED